MKNQYHILNGDSLRHQFPKDISGALIVARECLVEGNMQGQSLSEFFYTRANYISTEYGEYSHEQYMQKTVSEFAKIKNIQIEDEVNLWFEDDLFCQVNFWFVIHLLQEYKIIGSKYLIRPTASLQFGFGGMDHAALQDAYQNRQEIDTADLIKLGKLWNFYKNNESHEMLKIAKSLHHNYPFLINAIKAHIDRIPRTGFSGRPIQTLISIMRELETEDFSSVFKEFSKREPIYGFGDLQVKRLLREIKKSNNH